MHTVGENLKRLRRLAGFTTQAAFADHLGMKQPRLSDIENGRTVGLPEVNTLLRLAKGLRCSVNELLAGVDPEYDRLLRDLSCHTPQRQQDLPAGGGLTGGSATHAVAALPPDEQALLRSYRHLDARKQEAAIRLFSLFGELDATAVRHARPNNGHAQAPLDTARPRLPEASVRVLRRRAK